MRRLSDKLRSCDESNVDDILVIGIDFGTTFSGAAWATIDDFEDNQINMILSWPGHGGEEGKAPTAIYYDENDEVKWGYDISEEVVPLQWFKLLLLRSEDLPEKVQQSEALLSARRRLRQSGKSAVDVVADYLRALWKHIISTIHKDRGELVVDGYELHVVLTVPAIWQGYARQAMREAAKKAGIMDSRPSGPTTLSFAPEPEAAAMATMYEFDELLQDGDVYIICDAGGGTVDLINYRITKAEPLELHEVGIGTGDLCGGIFVDEAFQRICKGRLGRQWNNLSGIGIKEIMTKEWELGIKPQFRPHKTKKGYIVSIPAEAVGRSSLNDPSSGIKNGRIHFSSFDIEEAFAEVFTDIQELIDGQIEKAMKAHLSVTGIIMVGGLGSSAYLYDYLSSIYTSRRMKILQSDGMKPRTAICRGAIFKGFIDGFPSGSGEPPGPGMALAVEGGPSSNDDRGFTVASPVHVVSSVARQSIGVLVKVKFIDGEHEERDRVWDPDEGCYYAENQILWLMQKGRNVRNSRPAKHSAYHTWTPSAKRNLTFPIRFCQSQADSPPRRKTNLVKKLCSLDCKVGVRYQDLEDYSARNGRILKQEKLIVEMVPSGATVEFSVYHRGKRLSSREVNVEFD